jgi:lipoprotein LprG
MRMSMRTRAVALALLTAAALTACSGGADTPAARKLTPAERLAAAKARVDAATSMHLTLRSSGVPDSANGPLGADGSGTHAPAFKGTLEARISGIQAKVEVVALDKVLYVKLPFTTGFTQIDPEEYHAPNPAQLFATEGGITSLMTATTNPVEGAQTRAGVEVLRTITGKLPGDRVVKVFGRGEATKAFDVIYGITDPCGELRPRPLRHPPTCLRWTGTAPRSRSASPRALPPVILDCALSGPRSGGNGGPVHGHLDRG